MCDHRFVFWFLQLLYLQNLRENEFIDYKQMTLDAQLRKSDVLYNRALALCNLGRFEEAMQDATPVYPFSQDYPQLQLLVERISQQQVRTNHEFFVIIEFCCYCQCC